MTLTQWCERYEVKPAYPATEIGTAFVTTPQFIERGSYFLLPNLYNLDDYVVSRRCGQVFWLVPHKPKLNNLDAKPAP